MKTADIMELLRTRHAGDVYYEEPVIKQGELRMDAWAMIKSWAHPRVIGYEVKLTRADFLSDHKMQRYLPYCNEMYLICPRGIVDPSEVNESTGLIFVASTGNKLITRKKAPWRDVQIPEQFYRALLFGKASSDVQRMTAREQEVMRRIGQLGDLEAYVQGRKELSSLGYDVGKKICKDYRAMLYDKDQVKYGTEKLERERSAWDQMSRKLRQVFGYRFDMLIRDGEQEYAAELMREKLEALEHPEKQILGTIERFSKELEELKRSLS